MSPSDFKTQAVHISSWVLVLLLLATPLLDQGFGFNAYNLTVPLIVFHLSFILSTPIKIEFLFYLLILLISGVLGVVMAGATPAGFFQTFYIYCVQPLAVYLICANQNDPLLFIRFISKLAIVSFLGSVYFYFVVIGLAPDLNGIFAPEFTTINGESLVIRNTSIYTNSLVASGIGLIHLCASAFMFKATGKKRYLFLLTISLFVILATLSRRAFVPAFFVCVVVFFAFSFTTKARVIVISGVALGLASIYFSSYLFLLVDRILSGLDFSGRDQSNISRLILIQQGLLIAAQEPFGSGFGTLSSIGKTHDSILESQGFLGVTESLYVGVLGEIGWFFCVPLLFLVAKFVREVGADYRLCFVYPFAIESVMGLGLLNPTVCFLFIACIFSTVSRSRATSVHSFSSNPGIGEANMVAHVKSGRIKARYSNG